MSKKAIYRHKSTGDLFAIETDEDGNVLSTHSTMLRVNSAEGTNGCGMTKRS